MYTISNLQHAFLKLFMEELYRKNGGKEDAGNYSVK